jgi:flagellar basal-body rod protein FlgF
MAPGYDASAGPLRNTGNDLDIGLREGVWLGVNGADGKEAFTRAGDLHVTAEGLLTTASGRPVLGTDGGPLGIPPHTRLSIGNDGTVSIQPLGQGPETTAIVGRLRLAQTDSPQQLSRGTDGLMRAQTALPQATGNVMTSGVLEGSNVDTAGTLVQMIELSRTFEMQMKILHSGDEMARSSTSLLRPGG